MTITEGGYLVSDATGEFDVNPERSRRPHTRRCPSKRLRSRRRSAQAAPGAGMPGLTIVSCDNMPGNGNIARRSFTGFAG
jgi:mannitol 2-dehydrogenase